MEIRSEKFLKDLNRHSIICIDSPVLIYHLELIKPYDELTRILIKKIAGNQTTCFISALTITELLTKPYRLKDREKINLFEMFIRSIPNTIIKSIDYDISKKAASLRGEYNLRTPDALVLATAIVTGSDLFITNDIALKRFKIDGIKTITLDDYVAA